MLKVLSGLVVLAFLLAPQREASAGEDPVVAEIGKEQIHLSEVKDLHRIKAPDVPFEVYFNQLTDGMINDRLVVDEAIKAGLKDDPRVKEFLRLKELEYIMNLYIQQRLDKVVTQDVLKAEYALALKEMPPRREAHARRIVVATEAEAKAVIAEYKKSGDFEALAKKSSLTPEAAKGGDMGYVTQDQLQPQMARAVFNLAKGGVSQEPVELGGVWSVYKVEDLRTAPKPTFDQVKRALFRVAGQKAMQKILVELRAAAKVKRYNIDGSPME